VSLLPIVAALPWLLYPVATIWRVLGSPNLEDEPNEIPLDPPLVSVIVPARNESRNIGRCVRSILASAYPSLELVVVDDRSEDDTAAVALAAAAADPRCRVVSAPPLEAGWFGKQWACTRGVREARGGLLVFTDADTVHAPDLLTRCVGVMRARRLDFLTVAGQQELGSFWERVVQPHIFGMLVARFGGPASVNRSTRVVDKMANGQFMMIARPAFDSVGGFGALRAKVAEDLALAQMLFARGFRTELVLGPQQITTRMYASLGEIVRGWMKNMYAASLDVMPWGWAGRALVAPLLLLLPVATLAPAVALALALVTPASSGVLLWAAICIGAMLAWWGFVYHEVVHASVLWALTFPLGAAIALYIALRAVVRGRRVEWKGREYRAG